MKAISVQKVSTAALLIAVGIIIPMFSPIRIIMEPASFTLASHVAIFIAMMISPGIAAAVAIGTTFGFFFGGFPVAVVFRAASHLGFSVVGACYLQRHPETLASPLKVRIFSLLLGVLHAACEMAVVTPFYLIGFMGEAYYQQGFIQSVVLLTGLGSVMHSVVDFEIAWVVFQALRRQRGFRAVVG